MPHRFSTLLAALLLFGVSQWGSAQSPTASPAPKASPAPSASPAATASPAPEAPVKAASDIDADDDIDMDVDGADLANEAVKGALEAQKQAMREVERALATVDMDRSKVEREAMRAAKKAMSSAEIRKIEMQAMAEARAAMSSPEAKAAMSQAAREAMQSAWEGQQEERERAREAARAKRDAEREAADARRERDRERAEADREKAQEKGEQIDELYDEAMEAIDEEEWGRALGSLDRLIHFKAKVDAALYWTSYAKAKLGDRNGALVTLAQLQKDFPASRWVRESKALEMEVRGKSGQAPHPDQEDDVDLKLMAVSALAQSDPTEAMPLLSKLMSSPTASRKVRERSLFVLAQMGADQAGPALTEVAKGNASPDLQRKAIEYLGVFGGPANRKVLSDIYGTTTDFAIRRQILNSFMISGDKTRVLLAAKTEKDPGLRSEAVRLLGVMGGSAELSQMYPTATTAKEKKDILQALFIGGAVEPVLAAAKGEKDKEVRLAAINNLGLMGRKSEAMLAELYRVETDKECKAQVLNSLFLQNNPTKLIEIARVEKDLELKSAAVRWLSLMNSKESRAYMMELLKN